MSESTMRGILLVMCIIVHLSVDAFLFSSKNKCPLVNKKKNSIKNVGGYDMKISKEFEQKLKSLSSDLSKCKLKLYVRGSYTKNPFLISGRHSQAAADYFTIGEAVQFELRATDGKVLCNELCFREDRTGALPIKTYLQCLDRALLSKKLIRDKDVIYSPRYDHRSQSFKQHAQTLASTCS
ncbi:hypothetical protein GJ496_011127 [Pomphorhynchus laevis]|nr:hypothetical protein GJ496_011127 [Pomphorhynchus laevis]